MVVDPRSWYLWLEKGSVSVGEGKIQNNDGYSKCDYVFEGKTKTETNLLKY